MSKMASSWDEEDHERLLEQLIDEHYGEDIASINNRRPFVDMERQPDLMIQNKKGEVDRYAYFLQPVEVKKEWFEQLAGITSDDLDLFVPYDRLEDVRNWLERGSMNARCLGFRLVCGQLKLRKL